MQIIEESWDIKIEGTKMYQLSKTLQVIKMKLKECNRVVFRHVERTKKQVQEKIKSLEAIISKEGMNDERAKKEKDLKEEYQKNMRQE